MSNLNVCFVCGNEQLVSVEILDQIVVGYCDCSEVLDVYCCVCNTCTCDGKCDSRVEIEDEEFVYVYEEAEILAASVGCQSCCQSCGQIQCKGPNPRGYCLEYPNPEKDAAFEAFLYRLREQERVAADGPEPVAVAPKWVEAAMVLMMIVSFFHLLYDIGTGKNNNPKLVFAWYAFCAYMIVCYTGVILWYIL